MSTKNRDLIPCGNKCYESVIARSSDGGGVVKRKLCPYWMRGAEGAMCEYLQTSDTDQGDLSKQKKICGVNLG